MNDILFTFASTPITPWTFVGLLGAVLFTGRWVVQLASSYMHGKPIVNTTFWYISIAGSLFLLVYFTFGTRDLVGVTSNLFPSLVAGFNLVLAYRDRKKNENTINS